MQNRTPVFAIAALALFLAACGDKKPAETTAQMLRFLEQLGR